MFLLTTGNVFPIIILIMIKTSTQLLDDVEQFCDEHNLSERHFCLSISKHDHNLIKRIRGGSNITIKTVNKIYKFMGEYSKNINESSY